MEASTKEQAPARTLHKYGRVVRHALVHWPTLAGIIALTLALSALAALQPWPLKLLVDYGIGDLEPVAPFKDWLGAFGIDPSPVNLIWIAAAAAIVLFAANAALDSALTWAWSAVGQRMVYDLAADLFLQMQRLSLLFHARRNVGDSITRITGDAWCVYSVTEGILIAPLRNLLILASVGAVAWQLDPGLTLIMLCAAPPLAGSAIYFGERLKGYEREKREAQARIASFLHQVLGAMPMVQAFGASARNLQVFGGLAHGAVRANQKSAMFTDAYGLVNGIALTLGTALVLFAGGGRVLSGELSLGSLLVFLAYMKTLEGASRSLLTTYGGLRAAEASIDRVMEVLDANEAVREAPSAEPLPARQGRADGRLVFDHVTFGYQAGRPVLRDLSLELAPGETVALVGTTGAGKSTLAALVPRFFDPWEGRVILDGMDLKDLRLASLRSEIAIVLQEPFLLPLTVAENIAYGRQDATREEIVAAAVAANAHEFIRELPHGYNTVLGEQGATLSGGQRQRLAIARALLKDARVLILDEPTSALDVNTEHLVVEAFERLMKGRTTLIIAHRLSTVRRAHRIAVLDDGRVVELGSHAELISAGGRYARLHALQAITRAPEGAR